MFSANDMRVRKFTVWAIFSALFLFSGAVTGIAQQTGSDEKKSETYSILTVSVKPEMTGQFEEMIKTEFKDAYKKGGGTEYHAWHMMTGDMMKYVFVERMEKLSDMGAPGPVAKGLGEKAPAFYAKLMKMIDGVHRQVSQTRPALSFMPRMKSPPGVAVVTSVKLKPGKQEMFEKFIADNYLPVAKKSGVMAWMVDKILFGAEGDEYTVITMEKDFSGVDKGPPHARVLKPEEFRKMMEKFPAEAIQATETNVAHFHPEMSLLPPAPVAEKQ